MSSLMCKSPAEDSDRLLNRLLESVQECQKRYGGKTELATEFDECVSRLCVALERVFLHGLRSKPAEHVSALKQVSEIVANSLSLNSDSPSFWPFVRKHLTKHEQDRYNVLKHIWTDAGKGKAWIRSALNERSLERYFHTLLSNASLLKVHYEDWALLCDEEKSNLLPNMAAGLASILFAVSIDKPELNSCTSGRVERQAPEPIIIAPVLEPSAEVKELKKKRRVAKQLISFEDDNDSVLSSSVGSLTSESCALSTRLTKTMTLKEAMDEECNTSDSQSSGSGEPPQRKLSRENSGSRDRFANKLEGTLTPLEPFVGELTPISVESPREDGAGFVEVPTDVSAILTAVEAKNKEETTMLQEKMGLLTKENESLKEQLKKYMGAVHMLKKDGERDAVNGVEADYKEEAKLFEQKLVQVAEMHAELMDFNVVLQQTLCQKENLVERLKSQLEELRGPIPEAELSEEMCSCVNIWIPSAFLTGTGSEAHHVYQIYLRAGSDEWNIYRRYAQFHAFHSDLKKLDPAVGTFDFPPKKSLRNKDSSLVEDRRKRLQKYLRRIISHWPELSQCNSRFLLEQHLSFFKDQKDGKKENKTGIFSSRRSVGNSSGENHYTGL